MKRTVSRTLSVAQEHEFLAKLEAAGLTSELAQRVIDSRGNKLAKEVVEFIAGNEVVEVATSLIINLAAEPFIPQGWQVEEHQTGGEFEWDPGKISLYLSERQQGGKVIQGHKLREELKDRPVLNANVLDWLLTHRQCIPAEWKGKWVFFWGTVYRSSGGILCVRCLYWRGGRWRWRYYWLDDHWVAFSPALVLAS